MKKFLIKTAVTLGVGLLITLFFSAFRGAFSAESLSDKYRFLCDGFFGASALLLGAGALVFCANGGTFDMLTYGTKRFFSAIFSSRKKLETETKKTFADYRAEKSENPKPFLHMFLSGGILLIVALIFLALYSAATP